MKNTIIKNVIAVSSLFAFAASVSFAQDASVVNFFKNLNQDTTMSSALQKIDEMSKGGLFAEQDVNLYKDKFKNAFSTTDGKVDVVKLESAMNIELNKAKDALNISKNKELEIKKELEKIEDSNTEAFKKEVKENIENFKQDKKEWKENKKSGGVATGTSPIQAFKIEMKNDIKNFKTEMREAKGEAYEKVKASTTEKINAALANGKISQVQADQLLQKVVSGTVLFSDEIKSSSTPKGFLSFFKKIPTSTEVTLDPNTGDIVPAVDNTPKTILQKVRNWFRFLD